MNKVIFTLFLLSMFTLHSFGQDNRSYDGTMNNVSQPDWGASMGHIIRMTSNGYSDSISVPSGIDRPNPREISNRLFDQTTSIPNPYGISDFGWAFGQFMDHDLSFVNDDLSDPIPIPVPMGDPFFDPLATDTQTIHMFRSVADSLTGTNPSNPRTNLNEITSWIDASNVYGSDSARAYWLRSMVDGKLKTSANNLLPFNTLSGAYNDSIDPDAPFMIIEGMPQPVHFVAGDLRANEQPILAALHTLFVREHNRVCDELISLHPSWNDEKLYQHARKMVNGYIQNIAFEEWLPALGIHLPAYTGYDGTMDPNVMNVFSAAAFRLGHTLINDELLRLDANGDTSSFGNVTLKDAFFQPMLLKDEGGLEPFFRGMATQAQQNFDTKVISSLRNFLFGAPGAGGLDLVAININRGRERGLPDYNTVRSDMGLPAVSAFSDITSDQALQDSLAAIYGSVNKIDPWVGMLAEDHVADAAIGSTIMNILLYQFHHLRDGDRYYFENDQMLSAAEMQDIKQTRLSDIILRNTDIQSLQDNVFFVQPFMTAIGDRPLELPLTAYPNPARSEFILKIPASSDRSAHISLMDVQGNILNKKQIQMPLVDNTITLQLEVSWPAGIYVVMYRSESRIGTVKVIKQ